MKLGQASKSLDIFEDWLEKSLKEVQTLVDRDGNDFMPFNTTDDSNSAGLPSNDNAGLPSSGAVENRWWLAVNASSCAPSPHSMPASLIVKPTPELLLGFRTQEEQMRVWEFMMTAPILEVRKLVAAMKKDDNILKAVQKGPDEPPSSQTFWLLGECPL